jgi:hypothetical protein
MRKLYDEGILPVLRNIQKMKLFLFSFVVFGTIGQFCFPQQLDERSWDSGPSVLTSQFLDHVTQQQYVASEDEDTDGSVSKRLGDLFSVYIQGHSTLPIINLNYETYFNSKNSFHYVLTYGYFPLRSPPLFS